MPGFDTDPAFVGEVPVPGVEDLPPELQAEPEAEGQWPRMLVLSDETGANVKGRLKEWIHTELDRCWNEREDLIDDLESWQADYWGNPEEEEKNFPFRRAANIVVPLTAIACEAVFARIINTIFSVEPFWSIRPQSRMWIDAAPRVQEFLQNEIENENSLDIYRFASDTVMEIVKLGTGVGKSSYERDVKKSKVTLPNGTDEDRYVEVRNGATLDYVPVANFIMRIRETDPQTAPWCGEEHVFTWGQLKRMALSGRMDPDAVDDIKAFWESSYTHSGEAREYHESLEEETSTEITWHEEFHIQEIWAAFDVDGDGVDEEIVFDYHYASDTILSVRYNWYDDVHRPYRVGVYFPVEGRLYGVGIGKQNEQFQEEITTVHRQRLDNATLANMKMIAIRNDLGYGPGEPIFPGKIWFVDNADDIGEISLSEIYPSGYLNEDKLLEYSERRTGVNEVILGMPQVGQPGTATGEMARLAEGNKRFDLVLKNIRRFFSLLGKDVLANFQQFGDQERHWLVMEEDGRWVERVLEMPPELVRTGAIVELTVTDSITNTQIEQQQLMALTQIMMNYYTQRMNLAAQLDQAPPEAEEFRRTGYAAIQAGDELIKRLLDTFRMPGREALLLNPLIEGEQGGARGTQGVEQTGFGGPQGIAGPPGVEGLFEVLGLGGG